MTKRVGIVLGLLLGVGLTYEFVTFGPEDTGVSVSARKHGGGTGLCGLLTQPDKVGAWWCLNGDGTMAPGSKYALTPHGSPSVVTYDGYKQIQLNPTNVSQDQYYASATRAPPSGAFTICVLGTKYRLNTVDWFAFGDHSTVSHVLAEDNGTIITAYDFSSTKSRGANSQSQETLVCESFTPSTEIAICAWGGDQAGALGGCNHQAVTNPSVTAGNLKWTVGAAETGTAYNMAGYVRGAFLTESVLSDAELLRIANAILIPAPPAGWASWMNGANVDGVGNNGLSGDSIISSWADVPAGVVADYASVAASIADGGQPHFVTSGEQSVAFTGVYNQVISPNSGHVLNSINATGVGDVFLQLRRRNTTINGERRISGDSEGQAGFFIGLNAFDSGGGGEGSFWVILGNGSTLPVNYRTTAVAPLGQVYTFLVRFDGANLKFCPSPFTSCETSAFAHAAGGTDAGYDDAVGAINPSDVVGQQFFEGDVLQRIVYTSNLDATHLSQASAYFTYRQRASKTQSVWAALGDSLTEGATMAYPWPARATASLRPYIGVANQGKSGDTCAQATTRYNNVIHGQGFHGLLLMIGTNDLSAGTSAATVYTCIAALVATAKADGLSVILSTVPPTNGFAGWTGAMQTQWGLLNSSIRSTVGVTISDDAVFLADPNDATAINPAYDYGDHRHLNDSGGAKESSVKAPLIQSLN